MPSSKAHPPSPASSAAWASAWRLLRPLSTPSAKAPPPAARQFGGLGLGLAISKALIDAHGGSLTAHSEGLGRGSTFTIQLPSVQRAKIASPPAEKMAAAHS